MSLSNFKINFDKELDFSQFSIPSSWNSLYLEEETQYNPPKYPSDLRSKNKIKNFEINTQDIIESGPSSKKNKGEASQEDKICSYCKKQIKTKENFIYCNGICNSPLHITCAEITPTQFKKIKELGNLIKWDCKNCKYNDNSNIMQHMNEQIFKLQRQIDSLMTKFNEINTNLSQINYRTYASILSHNNNINNNTQGIIIKPKNKDTIEKTNKVIQNKINHRSIKAPITSYNITKTGNIIIKSDNKEHTTKLMDLTKRNLGKNYDVRLTKARKPRVVFIGTKENYKNSEDFKMELMDLNYFINSEDQIEIKYQRKSKYLRNNKWIIYAETSGKTFNKIINKFINISWGQCIVKEDFNIRRCMKCCGYGHKTTECRNKQTCSFCGENHKFEECSKNTTPKCINCYLAKTKSGKTSNINHKSNDQKCPIYLKKIEITKNITNYLDNEL